MADAKLTSFFEQKTITPTFYGNVFQVNNYTEESLCGITDEVPIIDYLILKSDDPAQRSRAIDNIGKASRDFGFFLVKNHPVPESLSEKVTEKFFEFFDMTEEEKRKYDTRDPTDMIRWWKADPKLFSREQLNIAVHPTFHCPPNPSGLSEILKEYSKMVRELGLELFRAISKSLGLEEDYIEKKMNLESGHSFFTANDYPPRQHSQNRMGQFDHTDTSLLTLIIQNVGGGLQIEHEGKWINVKFMPNWIIVNIADHLEILTNGKCKAVVHRVVLNNEKRRFTLPMFLGPSLNTIVSPAPEFVDGSHPPAYPGMSYQEYLELNGYQVIDGKSWLQQIRY
ncbi:hypothetical protein K2173_022934 [Erythroxylum novogranatense]|uniref:Fe2OG dioxygenase domain-containing protein n=1 Tax=Erythroxylum novogranatense TaxID=1862640 RepID=A0AAV8T7R3_9ROSI|nr:hypothetical protein K2173_022934 [Erythroxylum novogranatense]